MQQAFQTQIAEQVRQTEDEVVQTCNRASDFVKTMSRSTAEDLTKNEAALQSRAEADCSAIQRDDDNRAAVLEQTRDQIGKASADLRARMKELELSKTIEVSKLSDRLRTEAMALVTIQPGHYLYSFLSIVVENKSPYCLREIDRLEFSLRGVKLQISDLSMLSFGTVSDRYGFDTGCVVLPNSSKSFTTLLQAPGVSDPRAALLAAERTLPVTNGYLIPDAATAHYKFSEAPNPKKVGDRIEYSLKDLDFPAIAARSLRYPGDSEIERIRSQIGRIEKDSDLTAAIEKRNQIRIKLESCKKEQSDTLALTAQTQRLKVEQAALGAMAAKLQQCLAPNRDLDAAATVLKNINRMYQRGFVLPERERISEKAAVALFFDYVKRSGARQVDADINGRYAFSDLEKGDYLLLASLGGAFDSGFWFVPISVKGGKIAFDLNGNNFTDVPLAFFLAHHYQHACLTCSPDKLSQSMQSDEQVVAVYAEHSQALSRALDELNDSIRRLRNLRAK